MSVDAERAEAGRALAAALANPDVRGMFKRNQYVSGTPIVLALPDDTVHEVFARVRAHHPETVLIAVRSAERPTGFRWMPTAPGRQEDTEPGDDSVGSTASISMLADYLERRAQSSAFTFRIATPFRLSGPKPQFGVDVDKLAVFA